MNLSVDQLEKLVSTLDSEIDAILNGESTSGSSEYAADLAEIRNLFDREMHRLKKIEIVQCKKKVPLTPVLHCVIGVDPQEVDYHG